MRVSSKVVVRRADIEDTTKRLTLQHVSFQSQGVILGIQRRTLQRAVFLDWAMRYYREQLQQHVMPDPGEDLDAFLDSINNRVRQRGLPSRHHRWIRT